jgi:hypothetical protein
VEVRHDEGVATRIGPEPCAGIREDVCEASAGECIGQALSLEKPSIQAPTPFKWRKAIQMGALARVPMRPGVVQDPGMCRRSLSLGTGRARVSTARPEAAGPRQGGEEP